MDGAIRQGTDGLDGKNVQNATYPHLPAQTKKEQPTHEGCMAPQNQQNVVTVQKNTVNANEKDTHYIA